MVTWHHRLNGHEFEQAPGVDDGQGSLVCCSPWGRKKSDTTERLSSKCKESSELLGVACWEQRNLIKGGAVFLKSKGRWVQPGAAEDSERLPWAGL